MSNPDDRPTPQHIAYSRFRRVKTAFRFVRHSAHHGFLERTQSIHVGPTYGVEPCLVKRIKARFRNELMSFGGDGK